MNACRMVASIVLLGVSIKGKVMPMSTRQATAASIVTRASFVMGGPQSLSISAHHGRTAEARVAPAWPMVMLTFSGTGQVEAVAQGFRDGTGAARRLPRRVASAALTELADFTTFMPAVSVVFTDTPAVTVRLGESEDGRGGWAHRSRWVDVTIAGCLWRLLDQDAHASILASMNDLEQVGAATLLPRQGSHAR